MVLSSDSKAHRIIKARRSANDFLSFFSQWTGISAKEIKNRYRFISEQKAGPVYITNFKLQKWTITIWAAIFFTKIMHVSGKKSAPKGGFFIFTDVIRSGNLRQQSGANVNATNTALLVREVQSNIFHRVELQTSAIGEAIIAGVMFIGWVIGRLEFTVTHTDYTVDARPIVQTVSRAGSDAVVLTFVVIARTVSTIFSV